MEKEKIIQLIRAYPRQIYEDLSTHAKGLSTQEAAKLREKYGPNIIKKVKKVPTWKIFLKNFISPMAILLWIAGCISIIAAFLGDTDERIGVLGDPQMLYLGCAIWMVNIINGLFSFIQQHRAGKATDALSKMMPTYARCMRDGQETKIPAEDLVPGDLVILTEGDRISADCRIIVSDDLSCAQSALDGEATPSRKISEPFKGEVENIPAAKNLVFAGTSVATGFARCIVYATGMDTELGRIASLTQNITTKRSLLQEEITRTSKVVSIIAVSVGLVIFVLGTIINGIASGFDKPTLYLTQFVFALGMMTAFIPEGLSPIVTLSLAKAVQRIAKEGALVKTLNSVETLGSTTVICSDKTGTLTKNEMTVKSLYFSGITHEVTGDGYAPEGEIHDADGKKITCIDDIQLKTLLTCGALCSDARLVPPDPTAPDAHWTVLGDPTEACLAVVARKGYVEPSTVTETLPRIKELNFDSSRKMMSTIHQLAQPIGDIQRVSFTKGAPKEVLDKCTKILDGGRVRPITPEDRSRAMKANDSYARNGLRVLGMAFRLLPKNDPQLPVALSDYSIDNIERDLVFVGLEAMQDPPRDNIEKSIAECRRAGVKIIMVTGDYGLTARAIARKIGIVDDPEVRVITGSELYSMSDEDLRAALSHEVIFARMAPEQKYRVVETLQQMGHVVAVTGDGVNDAPALKRADIGVAMGIAGTDVAKDAADMILTDDNFASIVSAIREGRAVYNNIKKVMTYVFNSNIPEAIPFLLPLFSFNFFPQMLTIMEVLLIDLGTDMVPAIALGSESPDSTVMDVPPRSRNEHLIDRKVLLRALRIGLQTTILSLACYLAFNAIESAKLGLPFTLFSQTGSNGQYEGLWRMSTSVILAAIVMCQIGIGMGLRSEQPIYRVGFLTNRPLLWGFLSELLVLFGALFIPVLNREVFQTNGITSWEIWIVLLALPFISFGLEELRKLILSRRKKI